MPAFSPKTPQETGPFSFDFSKVLQEDTETIVSATVTPKVLEGTDAAVASMVVAAPSIGKGKNGRPLSMVAQRLVTPSGVLGVRYSLSCLATTNAGNIYELEGDFYCLDQTT